MASYEEVRAEIEAAAHRKNSPWQNVGALILSLMLFLGFGLFNATIGGVLVLVGVLAFHESGHWLGMKLFGYRDVRMFFIPMLGAAVSGSEARPSATRRALVSLMGPLPGIALGIAMGFLYFRTREPWLAQATSALLFINGFNLLPFYPLDGGQFLEALLFARHPRTELVFRVLTLLAMVWLAIVLKSTMLAIFAAAMLLSVRQAYAAGRMASDIRRMAQDPSDASAEQIPRAVLDTIMPRIKTLLGEQQFKAKNIAAVAQTVWQKVRFQPAPVWLAILLVVVYTGSLVVGAVAPFVFQGLDLASRSLPNIEERILPDGTTTLVEVRHYAGRKVSEVGVGRTGLYDGPGETFDSNSGGLLSVGEWKDGYMNGAWTFFRGDSTNEVVVYDSGRPLRYSRIEDGGLREYARDGWPASLRHARQPKPQSSAAFPVWTSTFTRVGAPLPDFTARTLDGQPVSAAGFRGKVSWVNFFSLEYAVCERAAKQLDADVWQRFKGSELNLVAIGRDASEVALRQFAIRSKLTMPLVADPDRAVYRSFASGFVPRNYLVDRDGRIVMQMGGFQDPAPMISKAEELLAEPVVARIPGLESQ